MEDKAFFKLMESLMDDEMDKEIIKEVMNEPDPSRIIEGLINKFYKGDNDDKV